MCFLGTFFAFVPAEASAVFHPISSIYKWKQTGRPAVADIYAVSHFNRLQNVTQGGTHYEAQNRIEAF